MDYAAWFATPVALVAGWFGKTGFAAFQGRRRRHAERVARLEELDRLLHTSRERFIDQNDRARRLLRRLERNHPGAIPQGASFDRCFEAVYNAMTDEEREWHALLRAASETSLLTANTAMRDWLGRNPEFRDPRGESGERLAGELDKLERHLAQWFEKYDALFKEQPWRALIYLDDEDRHGIRFPQDLEPAVSEALARLR